MKTLITLLALSCLILSFKVMPPAVLRHRKTIPVAVSILTNDRSVIAKPSPEMSAEMYASIGLDQYGLSCEAFDYAWRGYQHLLENNKIARSEYLSICDFSQSSKQKRFYLIDIDKKTVLVNTYVAHGKNSGGEYATRFSNRPRSLQSSLGFYITQQPYFGEHGYSLRIQGVDPGYNDRALARNVVIHGADYAQENWLRRCNYLGRSYGCPALPKNETVDIINTIQNGTCLFIYHPSKNYLNGSKILND